MSAKPTLPTRMYSNAHGYFAFPLIEEDLELEDFDEWSVFAKYVEVAKAGHFDAIASLVELYDRDADWIRRGAYVRLIGDAGTDELLIAIHQKLLPAGPLDYAYDFTEALCYWGRLSIVPDLAEMYLANWQFQDGPYILQRLGLLLEDEPGPLSELHGSITQLEANRYYAEVHDHRARLAAAHGEHAHVFRGHLLDVEWIARRGLNDLAEGHLNPEMRHKFEAMTGIDCTRFYEDGRLQPLAAAAIFEAFLAGPRLQAFTAGQRYFFGHRVSQAKTPSSSSTA